MSIRKTVADIRREYLQGSLSESDVHSDPIQQFERWFEEAVNSEVNEPNAMTLATLREGHPTCRVVLLKGFDDRGFVFYTNYASAKGKEIDLHPHVGLNFFWAELERQVRIDGTIEKVSQEESEEYYQSRDRGSRIGAWVSPQSQRIPGRAYLEEKIVEMNARFENQEHFERPSTWGGYRVLPDYMEFWQGRPSRLHDRIVYERQEGKWDIYRIAP